MLRSTALFGKFHTKLKALLRTRANCTEALAARKERKLQAVKGICPKKTKKMEKCQIPYHDAANARLNEAAAAMAGGTGRTLLRVMTRWTEAEEQKRKQ